ncbi:MAG TPA: UrcA family protein [Steroidobacteraceae bacterium]|nr:UrcA family protein [Steroidobacteraceae bacterium]
MNSTDIATLLARLAGIVLVASAFLVTKLFAAVPERAAPSVTVKLQDLNSSAPEGVTALYSRSHHAAQRICGLDVGERNLAARPAEQSCAARAQARAIERAYSGAPGAYYASKQSRWKTHLATIAAN